jgi:thiol-disulfide isomerase/thioredoxin
VISYNITERGHTMIPSHSTGRLELKPGETRAVTLGGVGRPVIGRLVPSPEFETLPNWTFSHITAVPVLERAEFPRIAYEELWEKMVPRHVEEETDPVRRAAWFETEEGEKWKAALDELLKGYNATVERNRTKEAMQRVSGVSSDGTFRLDDIPEGNWTLRVQLDSPPPTTDVCGTGGTIGTLNYDFVVAAVPGGVSDEPLDIGTLEVKQLARQNPMPRVGEAAPEFETAKIEPLAADETYEDTGDRLRLSDYKGKYVILDFWATWCGPCLAKLPELKTLYDKIKDDDRFVLIGISLDNAGSEEMLGRFIARREMPWLHGLSGDWQSDTARAYGINAIPALLLIDPDGKVLLSNPSMAELTRTIDELRENLPPPR